MTTKSWNKLSTMLSDVLTETLDKEAVENVMSSWNSKKGEVSKLMGTSSRTKRKKDPNAPKKPNTSYIIFCGEQREKVKKANPDMAATEITTKLGELWKAVSEKEKKKYEELAQKDKSRYEKEMQSYTPPPEEEVEEKGKRSRGKKERTGPKRPLTAYMYFCQDKRPEVKEANPDMNGTAVTAELASRWKELTDVQKAPYEAKQAADKARYEAEKAETPKEASPAKTRAKEEAAPSKGRGKKEAADSVKEETSKSRGKKEAAPTKGRGKKEVADSAKEEAAPTKGRGKKEAEPLPAKSEHASKGKKTDDLKKTPGYEYFLKEQTEELESENPDWGSRKIQSEVNKLWKELDDVDREGYEAEALREAEDEVGSEVELEDD